MFYRFLTIAFFSTLYLSNFAVGQATIFSDSALFEAAAMSTGVLEVVEDFENNNTAFGTGVFEFPSGEEFQAGVPLIDTSGSGFPNGLAATQFIVRAEGPMTEALRMIEGGLLALESAYIGAFVLEDETVLDIVVANASAIGFDGLGGFPFPTNFTVNVFDTAGEPLLSGVVTVPGSDIEPPGFVEIVADPGRSIGQVRIDADNLELIDNVQIWTTDTKEILGDVNCDGELNLLDVAPFVALLQNGGFSKKADIDGNGVVNLLDVDPFIDLLASG